MLSSQDLFISVVVLFYPSLEIFLALYKHGLVYCHLKYTQTLGSSLTDSKCVII